MGYIESWVRQGLLTDTDLVNCLKYYYKITGVHSRQWLMLICLFSGLVAPATLQARETLHLNTAFISPLANNEQTGFLNLIVGEAFRRIGYRMESVLLPAERALINANAGIDDGDLGRIAGLQKTYPNLIQVPEIIMDVEFVVFARDLSFPVNGWQSLKPYSVAYITGWKILERNITEASKVTQVKNVEQLFTMLAKNRIDTIVYSRWSGLSYIKRHHVRGVKMLEPPLDQQSMYVYLHKKHQHLIPKLVAALQAMKVDGSYERAYQQILAPLVGK